MTLRPQRLTQGKLVCRSRGARAALLLGLALASCRRSPEGIASPLRENGIFIDSLFAEYASPGAPGAAVLVEWAGQVVASKGYGLADIERRTSVDPRTTFQLASLTKPFTAVATLMLIQDGRLTLDETITDVFPDFPSYGRRVTMRHLLSHTDGLIDGRLLTEGRAGETGALARLRQVDSLAFPAGEQFRYGNAGYALLADVVAKRSGMRFGAFLQQRIFTPLGMNATFVCGETEPALQSRALGYAKVDAAWTRVGVFCDPSGWLGAGGVVSSVSDLLKFAQALMGNRLLPASVSNEAFSPFTLNDGSKAPFGYGWMVRTTEGRSSVAHFGSMAGFRTYMTLYPERRLTIVVLVNRNPENDTQLPGHLSIRIADRLLQAEAR